MLEARKPVAARDWNRVLAELEKLGGWALKRGAIVLRAWSQWYSVVILSECLGRFDEGVEADQHPGGQGPTEVVSGNVDGVDRGE